MGSGLLKKVFEYVPTYLCKKRKQLIELKCQITPNTAFVT